MPTEPVMSLLDALPTASLFLCLLGAVFCEGAEPNCEVRRAAVAGAFYPDSPAALRRDVQACLDACPTQAIDGEVVAAMAPHAGYVYSAPIAARAFRAMSQADFDTIVIIGHDAYTPGIVAFLSPADAFDTPLGRVPVATDMVRRMLDADPGIRPHAAAHTREHTVEVQLPFLQVMGRDCAIVPVLFGDPTIANCRRLARAIDAAAGDRKVFVLSSTDMSHYPPYEDAVRLDRSTLAVLEEFSIEALFAHLDREEQRGVIPGLQTALCSRGGLGTAMLFANAHGANRVRVLHYANSGDAPMGDRRRVVGYGAAVFVRD